MICDQGNGQILSSRAVENGFPHHGAVAFGHYGKEMFEVFKYLGVEKVGYNQPAGLPYGTENPF